jgi:hypothetical protein
MTDIDIINLVGQTGFPIAVAAFLLWKGYTQDKEYMEVLKDLRVQIQNCSHKNGGT